jgi:SMI1 / KNR4 family (SUKH-1)
MPDKFDTLIQNLERIRANGQEFGVFGEEAHSYLMNPPLSENEVLEFEAEHGVGLPDDYRQFLMRVGNGGAGPYYGLFKLGEMDQGFDQGPWGNFVGQLSAPFPHVDAWNDLADMPEYQGKGDEKRFNPLIEAFDERYFDNQQVNGALPICHLGCARRQWLVITGSEAGNVWCDDRADYKGLYPLQMEGHSRVNFFEWYSNWLDEVLSKLQLWEKNSSLK